MFCVRHKVWPHSTCTIRSKHFLCQTKALGINWDMSEMYNTCSPLTHLLRGLENRPISSAERRQIEFEIQCFVKENNIKDDSAILRSLHERLSFSHFSTASCLKWKTIERKPSLGYVVSEASMTNGSIDISRSYDFYSLAMKPAETDLLYICCIRRTKSALSTSYRMSIERTRNLTNRNAGM